MDAPELSLDAGLQAEVDRLGLEFLADFYAAEVARRPDDVEALKSLGNFYTQLGRFAEGLSVDQELVRREPDDETVRYNLACSLCLVGRIDEALAELDRAVACGYDDAQHLAQDEDLEALRGDARFEALIARLAGPGSPPGIRERDDE